MSPEPGDPADRSAFFLGGLAARMDHLQSTLKDINANLAMISARIDALESHELVIKVTRMEESIRKLETERTKRMGILEFVKSTPQWLGWATAGGMFALDWFFRRG